MKPPALCLIFAVGASLPALGQVVVRPWDAEANPQDAIEKTAKKILKENRLDYNDEAVRRLQDKGEWFQRQRVEVTGVLSNDDSGEKDPNLFDAQIKPSFSDDQNRSILGKIRELWDRAHAGGLPAVDAIMDSDEVRAAMRGETTPRARGKLAPYRNMEINEIVAHSWGTELVYAAIMNGELRPPKKLIVVGVPDGDYEKWSLLSANTGTELHFVRADNDKVAEFGAWVARQQYNVDLRARWESLCKQSPDRCPAHSRPFVVGRRELVDNLPVPLGHDRLAYYDLLKSRHLLTKSLSDLDREQALRVEAETKQVKKDEWESALNEARLLVQQARQQWRIAKEDEDARTAKILRCRGDGREIIDDSCLGREMNAVSYTAYRESLACERDAQRGASWITRQPPMPPGYAGSCRGELAEYLRRAGELDPENAASYVKSFFDKGDECRANAHGLAQAACSGRTLTDADMTTFYRNDACVKARLSVDAYPTAGNCAHELQYALSRRYANAEQANALADDYRQKFAPPPPAPPPPASQPPIYHRPLREDDPSEPAEEKCHMEYMGEGYGGWVRWCRK